MRLTEIGSFESSRLYRLQGEKRKQAQQALVNTFYNKIASAIKAEIQYHKRCLLYVHFQSEGMGIVGHSARYGLESASVTHNRHIFVHVTGVEGASLTIKGAIVITPAPHDLAFSISRTRVERLQDFSLPDYVPFLIPEHTFEPRYSSKRTREILAGEVPVRGMLCKLRQNFKGITLEIP